MLLTGIIINKISPGLKGAFAESIAAVLNKVVVQYGMDTADILEDFIPNLLVECAEFTKFEENLRYSASRLMQVWPSRFPTLSKAKQAAYNGQLLGNIVYGGRLGNTMPNDGWWFRGSGPLQGTGKGIITQFCTYYNAKFSTSINAYDMADKMRDHINLEIGLHFACWFFSIAKGLIQLAIDDNFKQIVFRINGGFNGLDDRTRYYLRAKVALAQ